MSEIKDIWIEAENWADGQWNPINDNSNVIVTLKNGEKYCATFFTYSNIRKLTEKNKETGECLNGKYFWASDMILIDKCSREDIEHVIESLLIDEELINIFNKIE